MAFTRFNNTVCYSVDVSIFLCFVDRFPVISISKIFNFEVTILYNYFIDLVLSILVIGLKSLFFVIGVLQNLINYETERQRHVVAVIAAINSLNFIFSSELSSVAFARLFGLGFTNSLIPLKVKSLLDLLSSRTVV